jgi:D-alanyl-D-alanine carboxypeptidase (penicillin-binding protein 5/6)
VATPPPARRRRLWLIGAAAAVVLAGGGFVAVRLAGPLPAPRVVRLLPQSYIIPGAPPVLPWPAAGQAMVEVEGLGALGSSGAVRPVPIASVAKVMTAHLVLRDHPLGLTEDGPTLTVTAQEADAYPTQLAQGQSLVPVLAGEALTERQALQALLLPSANNVALILARWDAGDQKTFVARMNQEARRLGMAHTTYTDPSGLDAATVSTAVDQVVLARAAMKVPALAQIVAQPQATIPVAGLVKNVNKMLGQDGIVGVKTGSTDQAGGCLVFAADVAVEGQRLKVVGAVLGPGPAMADAFTASHALIEAGAAAIHAYRVVRAGQAVATVLGPLGAKTTLAASGDLEVLGWPGLSYRIDTPATVPAQIAAAVGVGTLRLTASGTAGSGTAGSDAAVTTVLRTTDALIPPHWWQRIAHA